MVEVELVALLTRSKSSTTEVTSHISTLQSRYLTGVIPQGVSVNFEYTTELDNILAGADGKTHSLHVSERSILPETPLSGREGGLVSYLGSLPIGVVVEASLRGDNAKTVYDSLHLGDFILVKYVVHDVTWLYLPARLQAKSNAWRSGDASTTLTYRFVLAFLADEEWQETWLDLLICYLMAGHRVTVDSTQLACLFNSSKSSTNVSTQLLSEFDSSKISTTDCEQLVSVLSSSFETFVT